MRRAALLVIPLGLCAATARGGDPGWPTAEGRSDRPWVSDLQAPLAAPGEAWRHEAGEPPAAGPVVAGGVAFVVTGAAGKRRTLRALAVADGTAVGQKSLGAGGRVALAAWPGGVAIADPDSGSVQAFVQGDKGLRTTPRWKLKAPGIEGLWLHEGVLGLRGVAGTVEWAELEKGESRGRSGGAFSRPFTAPFATRGSGGGLELVDLWATGRRTPEGKVREAALSVGTRPLWRADKGAAGDVAGTDLELALETASITQEFDAARLAECGVTPVGDGFLLTQPARESRRVWKGGSALVTVAQGKVLVRPSPVVHLPLVVGSLVCGFDAEGRLLVAPTASPTETEALDVTVRPEILEAAPHATAAGDVLLAAGIAVNVRERRVLWRLDALDAASPLIPVAPARLLAVTRAGSVVVLGE